MPRAVGGTVMPDQAGKNAVWLVVRSVKVPIGAS
jgi:hypothetical protein